MLANLMMLKESVAIAGSHGKTTITCILAHIFTSSKLDPTYIIGGKVESFASNAKLGQGKHIFTEADESDGSFLLLRPHKAIISNIDNDHLETYQNSLHELKKSFRKFCLNIPFHGKLFVNGDSREIKEVVEKLPRNIVSFGFDEKNDIQIFKFQQTSKGSSFSLLNNKTGDKMEDLFKQIILKNPSARLVKGIDEAYQAMLDFAEDNFLFLTQGAGNTSLLAEKFKN